MKEVHFSIYDKCWHVQREVDHRPNPPTSTMGLTVRDYVCASNLAVEAVLGQTVYKKAHIIYYASRTLNPTKSTTF